VGLEEPHGSVDTPNHGKRSYHERTAESARLEYFAMGLQPTNHRKKRGTLWREIEGFGVVDRKRSRKLGLVKS
jgi:hypothetical protein